MTSNAETPKSKIEVSVGRVTFFGEGSEDWLAAQLEKVLEATKNHPSANAEEEVSDAERQANGPPSAGPQNVGSLASFLKAKDATSNQTKRFLVTAGWLAKKGKRTLKTADVSKALKDNQQSRLSNPADALNKNVGKGFCEKNGDGFFITPEGWTELGETA